MRGAGCTHEQIEAVVRDPPPPSLGAIRQARYRHKASHVTFSDASAASRVTPQVIEIIEPASQVTLSDAPSRVTPQVIEIIEPASREALNITPPSNEALFIGKNIISSLRSDKKDIGHSNKSAAADAFAILTTVLSAETAQGVIEQRRKSKNPLTPLAAKGLAKEFAKCPDPNAAAEYWANRAWRGFKAEWMNDPQQRNGHTLREDYLERHSVVAAGKRLLQQCAEGFELFEGDGAEIRDGSGRLLSKG